LGPVVEFLANRYGKNAVINGETLIEPDPAGLLPTERYINDRVKAAAASLGGESRILMMPNVRWAQDEQEKPDVEGHQELAREMLGLTDGQVVFDAAAVWNKEHASITTILRLAGLDNIAWGFDARKMVTLLVDRFVQDVAGKYVFHVSGTKADKMELTLDLLTNDNISDILVSGNIANGLMQAQGRPVGAAAGTYGEKELKQAGKVIKHPRFMQIVSLPDDFMIARPDGSERRYLPPGETIPDGFRQFDVGKITADKYAKIMAGAKRAINSGVAGAFDLEKDPFEEGTKMVLKGFAQAEESINLGGDGGIAAKKYLSPAELAHVEVLIAGGSFLYAMAHRTFPVAEVFLGK
jgi:3-phosphoglycerate kinase